jgi:hypothetical protein
VAVAALNFDVDIIIQNAARDGRTDFSFTVHRNDHARVMDLLETQVASALGAREVIDTFRATRGQPATLESAQLRIVDRAGAVAGQAARSLSSGPAPEAAPSLQSPRKLGTLSAEMAWTPSHPR